MKKKFKTDGIGAFSLFKIIFFGTLMTWGLIILLMAVLSAFGITIVYYNDQPLDGWQGFLSGLAMIPIFTFVFSIILWCFLALGQWLWTRFHTIDITVKLDEVHHHDWLHLIEQHEEHSNHHSN